MMTTPDTDAITSLRCEARLAGDHDMADICDRALDGDEAAIAQCAEVISDAEMARLDGEMERAAERATALRELTQEAQANGEYD